MRARHTHRTRTLQQFRKVARPGERVVIRGRWAWFLAASSSFGMFIGQYKPHDADSDQPLTLGSREVSPVAIRVVQFVGIKRVEIDDGIE